MSAKHLTLAGGVGNRGRVYCGNFQRYGVMLGPKKKEQFKQLLETRLADAQETLAAAEQELRTLSARHADAADQATAEYERQALAHKTAINRNLIQNLNRTLQRIERGTFGECAECGGEIESKRLEAIPWARFCVACQQARERT
jgi:DnaK suppressor protein